MTCKWCHEFCPPNRKDGYCSDICEMNDLRLEIKKLRTELSAANHFLSHSAAMEEIKRLREQLVK